MSNKKQKHRQPPTPPTAAEPPSFFSNTVLFSLMAVLGGLLGYAGWQYYHDDSESRPVVTEPGSQSPTSAAETWVPATPANSQALLGQWVRTDSDGNYVLRLKSVADDGKLDAAYLNPNPINVAKAEATTAAGKLRVFVELRDVNYPGSTYDLRYDAGSDQLVGDYFQAGQQQHFKVDFERVKSGTK